MYINNIALHKYILIALICQSQITFINYNNKDITYYNNIAIFLNLCIAFM